MKIIEKSENKIVISEEIDCSLANALRKSADEILVAAVDEVEFKKNDSVLYDEVLALRIGLLPLRPQKKMKEGEVIDLSLKAKGPKTVYAEELEGNAEVVNGKTPLVKLLEGQNLEFVAHVKLGKGVDHAKNSPGLIYYSHVPKVNEVEESDLSDEEKEDKIQVNEKEFKEIKEGENSKAGDFIDEVVEFNGRFLKVEKSNETKVTIESWGQLKPEEILEEATKALKTNLKEVVKAK